MQPYSSGTARSVLALRSFSKMPRMMTGREVNRVLKVVRDQDS